MIGRYSICVQATNRHTHRPIMHEFPGKRQRPHPKTIFTRRRRRSAYIAFSIPSKTQIRDATTRIGSRPRARLAANATLSRSRGVNLNPLHTPNKKTTQSDTFFSRCVHVWICGARWCVCVCSCVRVCDGIFCNPIQKQQVTENLFAWRTIFNQSFGHTKNACTHIGWPVRAGTHFYGIGLRIERVCIQRIIAGIVRCNVRTIVTV